MIWFIRYRQDRALLRDCDRGDKRAIEQFNNLSYMNTIRITIRSVTEEFIDDPDEVESLATLSAAEIYSRFDEIPSRTRELRSGVRSAAHNFATDYLRWKDEQ
jgi:hypothetical protein